MRTVHKAYLCVMHKFQHIFQNIFRVTADGDDRITADGFVRITADSDY